MHHNRWWKLAAIVIFAVILDAAAHEVALQLSDAAMSGASGEVALEPSALSTSPLIGPILLTYLLATFGVLALTFVAIQAELPYDKWRKGLPILFAMDWGDVLLRTVSDIIWVMLGTFVGERWMVPQTECGKR